jgi:2-amino-4-hydroxy-6-hydroxymethyldihydropteridine diphosphokinase
MGSNLGDRWSILERAVASTPDLVAVSPVYETEPVGGPAGQPPFLNLVAELRSRLVPRELLDLCRSLEAAAQRDRRNEVRHGPRTLDVDILMIGDLRVEEEDLVVPHPRMMERRFVLAPLADLAPELVDADALERAGGRVRRAGRISIVRSPSA